jgi:hypothetical protein
MKPGTRVLLVEGDRSIADFVEPELERLGFSVRCDYDGVCGLEVHTATREVRRGERELDLTVRGAGYTLKGA